MDLLDVLDDLVEEQRDIVLNALLNELTEYSLQVIFEAQLNWDGEKTYEEFVKEQNEVIRACVKIEISPFGFALRKKMGLDPITKRTELRL